MVKDYAKTIGNPFEMTGINISYRRNKSKLLADTDGIIYTLGKVSECTTVKIDGLPFIKLFKPCCADLIKLNKRGIDVLIYIFEKLPENSTEIYLFSEDVMKYCGWNSSSNYYKGLEELLEYKFISRSYSPNRFWINVDKFYRGKRV